MNTPNGNCLARSEDGGILLVTINNPPHNYLTSGFFKELDACCKLAMSTDVKAVIFTGAGQVFSKGADLEELRSASAALDRKTVLYGNEIYTSISRLTKPVIAAINGPCLGAGLELALACHIRVCADKVRLGLPETSIGLVPGLGGIHRLIRVVGEAKAIEMVLLGDLISASRALELHLVSRIFPTQAFLSHVLSFARTMLAASQDALEEVLKLVALSRPEYEEYQIRAAAESFARLVCRNRV